MKKVSLFFVSLALMLCLAFGMTACGKDKKPKDPPAPPAPPTPAVTVDVTEASLIQNEQITVTATVANSENAAAFSLAAGGDAVVALQVSETTPNVAKLTAIADGQTTLTVALEGAQSVTVPVQVDGKYRIIAAETLKDNQKVFDAGVTGEDDGETATISVKHFIDGAKVEYEVNGAAAEISTEKEVCTVMAHQAGVADVTVKIMVPKAQQPEQPDPEQPETQAEEGEPEQPEVEYEELHSETYTVVCTDDWNKLAEKEASTKLLSYKEVKEGETVIGYAAYIDRTKGEALDVQDSEGVLRVPAIYNRKPVVSLIKNQENIAESYFLAYQVGVKKTQEQIDAMETDAEKEKAEADNAAIDEYEAIYNEISELYLPCTLTSIPDLTFRLAKVAKIEVQKGNHIASIGVQAFNEVNNLVSLNLEDCRALKAIEHDAFANNGNAGLSLVIPNNVERIGYKAFSASKLTKLECEYAEKNGEEYNPSIVLETQAAQTASGTFVLAQIQTVVLRNIKLVDGGCSILEAAELDMLIIGEDIGSTSFNNIPISVLCFNGGGWTMALAFKTNKKAEVLFEGAENWMPNNAADFVGVDNCGGLFGTFAAFVDPVAPGNCAPKKLYIHKDATPTDWLKGYYEQNTEFTGEGIYADYTEWTKKSA